MLRNSNTFQLYLAILVALFAIVIATNSHAQKRILILSWNVESGDNDPDTIAETLEKLEGYDIIALCEVGSQNTTKYAKAAAGGEGAKGNANTFFDFTKGTTGGADRMMIIWDRKRFTRVGQPQELTHLNEGNHRAPLVVQIKLKNANIEFLLMVNHLARVNADLPQRQAAGLSQWAAQQSLPIIAVGDYNFDYDIDDGEGNQAMKNMLSPGIFEWVRPPELFKTNASPKYNGVLDFIFIAHKPSNWQFDSKILWDDFRFPDDSNTSDQRPIQGRILIHSN